MSPPFVAVEVAAAALAGGAEVAEGLGAGGATGIWPHPLRSAAMPKSAGAVARRVASTVVLCHALTDSPAATSRRYSLRVRSNVNTPAHCSGRAA
jgi:hypothetical protein